MPSLTDLQARLTLYRNAETKILAGAQSRTVGDTVFTYADLGKLQTEIHRLENAITQASRPATFAVTFRGRGSN